MKSIFTYAVAILLSIPFLSFSQKKIQIVNSDSLVFEKKRGADLRRLYGHVIFKHDEVLMYCDSAHFYAKKNVFTAYSKIHITQDTEFHMYGDSLHYNGKSQLAKMRGAVKLIDGDMTLTTEYLDYNLDENVGYYFNGGYIVDSENTLDSRSGTYFQENKEMFFKDSVQLVNPQYTIYTDTLKYNTQTDIAFFFGPTRIFSEENLLYTENGWYNTKTDIAQFKEKSYINNNEYFVFADSLHYDRNSGIGQAFRNVLIKDTVEDISILSEYAYYKQEPEYFFVKDSLLMVRAFETDSLFLHADSLTMESYTDHIDTLTSDTVQYRLIKAFHKVRFYKTDLQGKCDSISYDFKDSLLRMHIDPIIWSDNNQIKGMKIRAHVADEGVDKIYVDDKAFLVQEDDTVRYNQVRGASMVGYIKNQDLYRVDVTKNGETIYFMREDDELIGVNKAVCESITIYLKNREIQSIIFRTKPEGTMFPPDGVPLPETRLNEFEWLIEKRPKDKNDIFIWQ